MGVHSRAGVSRVRISQVADDEIVSARGHRSVPVENSSHSTAGDPEWLRNMVTTTVMKAVLEYLHHRTPALIVVFVSGKTWILSL